MNQLHPGRFLFALFLVILLACFANAQARSCAARAFSLADPPEIMSTDQGAKTANGFGEGDDNRYAARCPIKINCKQHFLEYLDRRPTGGEACGPSEVALGIATDDTYELSPLIPSSNRGPAIHEETTDEYRQFRQPPATNGVRPDWLQGVTHQKSGVAAEMLMNGPGPLSWDNPNWSLPDKPNAEDLPNNTGLASGGVSFDGVNIGGAWALFRHVTADSREADAHQGFVVDPIDGRPPKPEHYHWGGLLAESFFFNVIENSFRVASDDQIRTLLASKPFWHDYAASIRHFNMRRWNDGDDFLVNYVGHPMQGAVSGFIEIQNDPGGRDLKIGEKPNYWESRFKAFLWAVAYSTHSEISPLGEAGIGNEGGWTYPLNCKTHCAEPETYKHYTNNTGWVDFVITPTVGTLWLLAEDTLDRFVSDHIQGDDRSLIMPKIIRGGLNPSRTMANALRFRAPWYRDSQQSAQLEASYGVHSLPSDDELAAARDFRRFSLAPYFHSMPFGSSSNPCFLCFNSPGMGFAFDYAWARWIGTSVEVEKENNSLVKGGNITGSTVNLGFGLRLMYDRPNNILSLAIRPGVMIGQLDTPSGSQEGDNADTKRVETFGHGFMTLSIANDVKVNRLFSMRVSVADTIVRYSNGVENEAGIGTPPYLSWLSKQDYKNESTWSSEIGPVLRF